MVMTGATVSTLIPLTVDVALLPALSTAVPSTLWLAPSADTDASGWQLAMPLTASPQVKCTATAALYQPLALGLDVAFPVMVGADLSTRTVTVWASSALPAWSTIQ